MSRYHIILQYNHRRIYDNLRNIPPGDTTYGGINPEIEALYSRSGELAYKYSLGRGRSHYGSRDLADIVLEILLGKERLRDFEFESDSFEDIRLFAIEVSGTKLGKKPLIDSWDMHSY